MPLLGNRSEKKELEVFSLTSFAKLWKIVTNLEDSRINKKTFKQSKETENEYEEYIKEKKKNIKSIKGFQNHKVRRSSQTDFTDRRMDDKTGGGNWNVLWKQNK